MTLRPIDLILDSTLATDNTAFVTGTRDEPVFSLVPPIDDCVGISLIYANVPFTYYVIDDTNNKFGWTNNLGAQFNCTIVPGTYNSINIGNQLIDALGRAGVTTTSLIFYVDSTTGKMVIYDSANPSFSIRFAGYADSAHQALGFDKTDYAASVQTFRDDAEQVITSKAVVFAPRVVNLTGPAQMYLASDFGSAVYGSVRNQTGNQGLLGFWPVNSNYQGTVEFVREAPPIIPISRTSISRIKLGLLIGARTSYGIGDTTARQSALGLNGEGYQIGLRFHVISTEQNMTNDALGNSVMHTHEPSTSHVYKPRKFQRTAILTKK